MYAIVNEQKTGYQGSAEIEIDHQSVALPCINLENVNQRWLSVLAIDATNELALTQLVSNFISSNDLSDAEHYLLRYEKISDVINYDRYHVLRARMATMRENYEAAITHWDLALNYGHNEVICRERIANASLKLGHIDVYVSRLRRWKVNVNCPIGLE